MFVIPIVLLTMLGAYVVTVALALSLLFITHATAPQWLGARGETSPVFLVLNVAIWCLSAAVGGTFIGWCAQWHPTIVAFGAACVIFAAIISVALKAVSRNSLNYEVTVAACAAAGTLGGSLMMQFFHLHL